MTPVLRIELIILAILAICIVIHTVNKRILKLKYSLVWLFISRLLITTACFPQIAFKVTSLVGIETPSNLIFLLAILSLLGICFSLTVIVSRLAEKKKRLIQLLSIKHYEWKETEPDEERKS